MQAIRLPNGNLLIPVAIEESDATDCMVEIAADDPEWHPRNVAHAEGDNQTALTLRVALAESNNAAAASLQQQDPYGVYADGELIGRDPDPNVRASIRAAYGGKFSPAQLRGYVGATVTLEIVGATGDVWGSDVYTDDSSIAAAAVHAGILKIGERGLVTITIAAGQESYSGSTRNGIASQNYGHFDGSFKIARAK